MACLELQRHGRGRRFFYHHSHTVLALVLVFTVGVFAPGVASAQDATIGGSASTRPSGHTRRSAGERQPRPTAAPGLWI